MEEEGPIYEEFALDTIMGIVFMCMAAGVFFVGLGAFHSARIDVGLRGDGSALTSLVPYLLLILILAVSAGLAYGGNAVREGERKGFLIVLVLSLPLLLGGLPNIVAAIILSGYAGLRLWARLGPEPLT